MVETDNEGRYEFRGLPNGTYRVSASMRSLADEFKTVTLGEAGSATADFALKVAALRQQVTVTATGAQQTQLESFESTAVLESHDLTTRTGSIGLGEALDGEPGIHKRGFGPAANRPVIRGFDGERVLILGDGIRTGTLSSQSGDHAEAVDVSSVERVEVVRGPATLLYGSGALGGVVNTMFPWNELHEHPHEGVRGSITGTAGTNNSLFGGSGTFQYSNGNWSLFGNGGGLRAGDYHTPLGEVPNSGNDMRHATLGLGRYADPFRWSGNYTYQTGQYGIPFAASFEEGAPPSPDDPQIKIRFTRQNVRFNTALVRLGPALESLTNTFNYSDWKHSELEDGNVGTQFFNKLFNWQGLFQQKRQGVLSGSFGGWYQFRDFKSVGAEALAPPTNQNSFAVFAVEQLNFERIRFQFGGRFERNAYSPDGLNNRTFNGASASAGVNIPLWTNGVVVANYTHSFRAPALEELYNHGPHVGNLTFEVGNPNLTSERGDGIELSLRHVSNALRMEVNTFYYSFRNFVFLAFQDEFDGGLPVANYEQGDSRYMGAEAKVDARLNQRLWLNLGFDAVDAQLKTGTPLPRIPPVRGRIGVDYRQGGLSLRPEVVLSNRQQQIYTTETPTAGYAVLNFTGLYTIARQHVMHTFGATWFNATDRVYRNHLSFIKNLAPEMGIGVRVSYTLNFF